MIVTPNTSDAWIQYNWVNVFQVLDYFVLF